MDLISQQTGLILAQVYDGIKSPDSSQITVAEAAREGMNGGMTAILTWAIPIVAAILFTVYLVAFIRRGRGFMPS